MPALLGTASALALFIFVIGPCDQRLKQTDKAEKAVCVPVCKPYYFSYMTDGKCVCDVTRMKLKP